MWRGKHGDCDFGEVNLSYFLKYLVARPFPIVVIIPLFTIFPKTASTVVGLISGKNLQISALEIGNKEFKKNSQICAYCFPYLHIKYKTICR